MEVMIVATRGCSHCSSLEKELRGLGVEYEVCYVEEQPDIAERYNIRHSPNLIVEDEIVCRGQPSNTELRGYLGLGQA